MMGSVRGVPGAYIGITSVFLIEIVGLKFVEGFASRSTLRGISTSVLANRAQSSAKRRSCTVTSCI